MIYTDLDEIFDNTGIENKYALAMIVSTRARQLSERRDSNLSSAGSELCISRSIEEIDGHKLNIDSSGAGASARDDTALG